ncbi:MAG: HAD-IC family P-type ATPase [Chloroflexi bacterium]|nr:HAD-IC family P-type ATPase [Chloroflexota bacterium]
MTAATGIAAPGQLAPTDPDRGLTAAEVETRRAAGLRNTPPPPTTRTYWQIVRENVFTFINNVLFLLGIALVLVGRPIDAIVSVGVISTNIVVSVVQEIRAKRTLDRVALLHRPTATVIRDGEATEVAPEQLVVGDLLEVGAGDQIVLDGRMASGRMQVDESQLTGESDLIVKTPGADVYSGSFAVSGSGRYIAEKVGESSLANQITSGARTFRRVLTPLQREVYVAIRVVLLIVVYLELMLVFNAVIKATDLADTVGEASILASLVPNGLFVSIAIAYALAAVRILRFGALVQQSNAVESLSHVDVLCLDKTGTLTANKLSFDALHPLAVDEPELRRRLGAATASGSAANTTSTAIAEGLDASPLPISAEVPFSSARKWSAVLVDAPDAPGGPMRGVIALGAPTMLERYALADGQDGRPTWGAIDQQVTELARQGLRVLLVLGSDATTLEDRDDDSVLPEGMIPLGLVTLRDELRAEAREALEAFITAGVSPRIISGDDPETVTALARQAGLGPELELLSGPEIDTLDDIELRAAVETTTIFGRITPQQKERLVDALRANGHYVAMIGDGVNDVLPLKKAQLGIAMQSGSQATRGVADLILTNDSFAALAPAVLEGQRIRNGMQDILKLFLTRISTVALLIVSSLIVGIFPLSIRNGSAVTLMTVGIPTILLVIWARPGPGPREGLMRSLLRFVAPAAILSSLLGMVAFYGVLEWEVRRNIDTMEYAMVLESAIPMAQTAVTAFLIAVGLFLVIFVEPPTEWWTGGTELSGDWKPTILAVALLVAIPLLLNVPLVNQFFQLEPLPLEYALMVIALVAAWVLSVRLAWRHRLIERFLGAG